MKITKAQITKAIAFLETIPEKGWCVMAQTKDFDPKNVGKCHCVIGHLSVNPNSPFYKKSHIDEFCTCTDEAFGIQLSRYVDDRVGDNIAHINNWGNDKYKQRSPKKRVLACLNDLIKS